MVWRNPVRFMTRINWWELKTCSRGIASIWYTYTARNCTYITIQSTFIRQTSDNVPIQWPCERLELLFYQPFQDWRKIQCVRWLGSWEKWQGPKLLRNMTTILCYWWSSSNLRSIFLCCSLGTFCGLRNSEKRTYQTFWEEENRIWIYRIDTFWENCQIFLEKTSAFKLDKALCWCIFQLLLLTC